MFFPQSKYPGRSKRPKIGWGLATGSLGLGTCNNFDDMLLLTGPFLPPFHPLPSSFVFPAPVSLHDAVCGLSNGVADEPAMFLRLGAENVVVGTANTPRYALKHKSLNLHPGCYTSVAHGWVQGTNRTTHPALIEPSRRFGLAHQQLDGFSSTMYVPEHSSLVHIATLANYILLLLTT